MTLVMAFLKPARWVPPSGVWMLLAKENTDSLKLSFHWSATSTVEPFFTPEMYTGGL